MTATEQWIFLCAAHKTPKECPAIDYTRHTLDGAACLLNSNKYFPSRLELTTCCRVSLEKLISYSAGQEISGFFGTREAIIVFTQKTSQFNPV
jgi:hypothetical protein